MKNRNAYYKKYMLDRYYKRRDFYLKKLGGKCVKCDNTNNLEFDHVDRTTKERSISKILTSGSAKTLEKEMSKCQLLCNTCHKIKTSQEQSVEHGGGLTGKKNCRCILCAPLKDNYNKKYR